jgi:ribosomal protein S18 acetylase RimI-like enzyme
VGPARPDERAAALDLLFRDLPSPDRAGRAAAALQLFESGEFPPDSLLVARGAGGPVGVLVCVPLAGGGASVWPPRVAPAGRAGLEDALVRYATGWLRGRGVKLAQALLTPEESLLAAPLLRGGFAHVTHLWHLRHTLRSAPNPCPRPGVRFCPYDPDDPAPFHATLLRTYEGTLDCPEVNGARSVDEIIAGHRAQGVFDPARWALAVAGGQPVGVFLLAGAAEGGDWEVGYVGVVPEARRRGYGKLLVAEALTRAKEGGAGQLLLSVDARNRPAWELYRGFGFEPFDRREVYLAVWR